MFELFRTRMHDREERPMSPPFDYVKQADDLVLGASSSDYDIPSLALNSGKRVPNLPFRVKRLSRDFEREQANDTTPDMSDEARSETHTRNSGTSLTSASVHGIDGVELSVK